MLFGHTFHGFDRDQFFSYYFALKAGLISDSTKISFTPKPTNEQLQDNSTLVIEGFGHGKASKDNGNFTNGINDEPAAWELYQKHRAAFDGDNKQKILDLANWIRSVEMHQPPKQLKELKLENLKPLTEVFYALKYFIEVNETELSVEKQQQLLISTMTRLMDMVLETNDSLDFEEGMFKSVLEQYRAKLQQDLLTLTEHAKIPGKLKTATSFTAVRLGYLDIRGLRIEKGGFEVVKKNTSADVIMLVDQELDDQDNPLGTQIKIQLNPISDKKIDLTELSNRLNTQEALFGKGFQFSQEYKVGGHIGIIGTAQWTGSELQAEQVWEAVQNYFDSERNSAEEFTKKVLDLSKQLGIDTFTVLLRPPKTPYELSQHEALFMIPNNGHQTQVSILEEDLEIYRQLLKGDPSEKQKILLSGSSISEPEAVVEIREQRDFSLIEKYIKQQDALRLLVVIDDLNVVSLEKLPADQLLDILDVISLSPDAIAQIWDKDNLRFRIRDKRLPEEISIDMERYKASRYKLDSLAKTIDSILVKKARSFALKESTHIQRQFAERIFTILSSETYLSSHQEQSYDSLLENFYTF